MGKATHPLSGFVLSATAALLLAGGPAAEELVVERVNTRDTDAMRYFTARNFEIATFLPGVSIDLVMTDTESEALAAEGFRVAIRETESQMKANLARPAGPGKGGGPALKGYRSYAAMPAELRKPEADHPDICELYDSGEHHAREPIGLKICFAVLNNIVGNYGKDWSITRAVDSKQIWFVPLVNPDGRNKLRRQYA